MVRDGFDAFEDFHIAAEFLAEFAFQTFRKGFARFTFAAGEFPQTAQMRVSITLGDQKFAVAEDETSGDLNDVLGFAL